MSGYYGSYTDESVKMERRIFPAHEKVALKVEPVGKTYRRFEGKWTVKMIPMEISAQSFMDPLTDPESDEYYDTVSVTAENGSLRWEYTFKDEEEWTAVVSSDEESGRVYTFQVYSLEADLFSRVPYLGDFHTHSCLSDGDEEPPLVAANHRKAGYDFIALTDHHQYAPSVGLSDYIDSLPVEFKVFRGEEVHLKPTYYMHIVHFGGKYSVNDLHNENAEKAAEEVKALLPTLPIPSTLNAYEAAYRVWTAARIREAGGLAIVAHPFWRSRNEYNMRPEMVKWLFANGYYDAFELISGQSVYENNLQTALYDDMLASGIRPPVIASSDSHKSTEPYSCFRVGMTFVFAKKLTADCVMQAVKDRYSVAMETANGRIYGDYRFVKYALFLKKTYLPHHDELCIEEGLRMADYYQNGGDPASVFACTSDRVGAYWRKTAGII